MNITGTFTPLVRIEETIVPDCFLDCEGRLRGIGNGMRAWVAEAKKEAGPDEFLRNSSDSASYFLCSFSLGHLDESGWDENKES